MFAAAPLLADVYWTLPAGQVGAWATPANWGGTLPQSSDTAYVINGGTAAITLPGAVCSELYLGDPNSANSGTIQMSGGGLSTSTNEYLGNNGTGTLIQSGGTNKIGEYLYLGYNSGVIGSYTLSGNGYLSVSNTNNEYVGYSGTGTFTQNGGTNNCGYLSIANEAGSNGTYSLSGNGHLVSVHENIGQSGTASFTQSGGTNSSSQYLDLGNTPAPAERTALAPAAFPWAILRTWATPAAVASLSPAGPKR
jgi:hypothetical protein